MTSTPRVSVLMPVHNAAAFVEEAVRALLAQDYPADRLHLIVVDDGSTDGTAAILDVLEAEHPDRVAVIHQANQGQVAAVNRAAQEADGELLAMLDADDVWPADKIAREVALLQGRPEVGLVYTDMCVIAADGQVIQDSWLGASRAPEGRAIGLLLEQNV